MPATRFEIEGLRSGDSLMTMTATQARQTYTIGFDQTHTGLLNPLDKLAHTGVTATRVGINFNNRLGCRLQTDTKGMKAK